MSKKRLFTPKSSWKPPTYHPNLEVFLSELEKQIFKIVDLKLGYSNISKQDWQATRFLAVNRSIVIKKAEKWSIFVFWDRNDKIIEVEKQLSDVNVYKDASFNEKSLQEFVGTSNQLF